jgi:hypothetical protein
VIAHNSAGPAYDIIKESEEYGFLCNTDDDYLGALVKIMQMSEYIFKNEIKN